MINTKKIISLVIISAVFILTAPVFAAKNGAGTENAGSGAASQLEELTDSASPLPSGNQVKNENQIKTQNQGEESKIKINNQEQENLETDDEVQEQESLKEVSPRNGRAEESMSDVAAKVEELLTTDKLQDGVGQQIRDIAREQKNSQQQMQVELKKLDDRKGLLKSILGPNFRALKNMEKVMEQNQLRIQQLTQLQNQLSNEGDVSQVQEAIKALVDQNTALSDKIVLETQTGSLLGWFFKLFAR
ncbi:MAG: hypothetical protein ACOYUB_04360 [Patescibacteria group bacterium]